MKGRQRLFQAGLQRSLAGSNAGRNSSGFDPQSPPSSTTRLAKATSQDAGTTDLRAWSRSAFATAVAPKPSGRSLDSERRRALRPIGVAVHDADRAALTAESQLAERCTLDLVKQGAALLDQQFWLWGQDVLAPQGNLLIRAGFQQHRPPVKISSSSCYRRALEGGVELALWGFGLMWSHRGLGALILRRGQLGPCLAEELAEPLICWGMEGWPDHRPPVSSVEWRIARQLLGEVCGWVSQYEHALALQMPAEQRQAAIDRWRAPCAPATFLADRWQALANALAPDPEPV